MTRRLETNDSHKGTLFTFLDVLICTMGLLILLLVAIARQVSLQRAEEAAAKPKVPEHRYEAELTQLRIDALRTNRETADAELAKHRAILQQIELRYRQLQEQLDELAAARDNLQRLAAGEPSSPHRAELSRLQGRIAQLKEKLAEAKAKGAGSKPSFAIVPYRGPNGTGRRPIYIECRADKIVLQPEGIELTEDDFSGSLGPGNPLASALRAAVEHMNRQRNSATLDPGEAYPLLLIRPDGINAYYAARAALTSWGADFGYEFVEADWKLDYGRADLQLAKVQRDAVEDARQRNLQLASGFGSGYGGKPFRGKYRTGSSGRLMPGETAVAERPTFRVNPAGGGLVQEGGSRGSRPTFGTPQRAHEHRGPFENSQATAAAKPAGSAAQTAASGNKDARSIIASPQPPQAQHGTAAAGQPGAPAAAANGSAAGTAAGSSTDAAIASDQKSPTILPQQIYGQHARQQSASSGSGEVESLADKRGADWGLPNAARGSFPITRPIRIQCEANRILLLADAPGGAISKEVPLAARTADSVDALVAAIWEHIDGWGIAGKGLYWRPVLHAEATGEGSQRLADLKILLASSGLTIRERVK